jgi:coenzyme F420-reducing hydrogenase gamma subunit
MCRGVEQRQGKKTCCARRCPSRGVACRGMEAREEELLLPCGKVQ